MQEPIIRLLMYQKTTTAQRRQIYQFIYKENEFLTLLGPSGCGKTTTLRIIGALSNLRKVKYISMEKYNNLPPYKRNINTVFQKYALFPNMDVENNIALDYL